jgi:hypothetical protein
MWYIPGSRRRDLQGGAVPEKRPLTIYEILARRRNARHSSGPRRKAGRYPVSPNRRHLELVPTAARNLKLLEADPRDFQPCEGPIVGRLNWHSRRGSANSRPRLEPSQPFCSLKLGRSRFELWQSQPTAWTFQKQTQANPLGLSHYLPTTWPQSSESKPIELNSQFMNGFQAKSARFSRILDGRWGGRLRSIIRSGRPGSWAETNGLRYTADSKGVSSILAKQMVGPKPMIRQDLMLKCQNYSFVAKSSLQFSALSFSVLSFQFSARNATWEIDWALPKATLSRQELVV